MSGMDLDGTEGSLGSTGWSGVSATIGDCLFEVWGQQNGVECPLTSAYCHLCFDSHAKCEFLDAETATKPCTPFMPLPNITPTPGTTFVFDAPIHAPSPTPYVIISHPQFKCKGCTSSPPPIPGPSSSPVFIPLVPPLPPTPSVSSDPSQHSAFNAKEQFCISQLKLQLESANNCLESTMMLLTAWQTSFHGEQGIWAQQCHIYDFQIASLNDEVGHLCE